MHDFRRTLASGMAEIGVTPHIIEAVLNHRTGIVSGIAAVYNRYKYEKEKREALELWQSHLIKIAEQYKDFVPKNVEEDVEI